MPRALVCVFCFGVLAIGCTVSPGSTPDGGPCMASPRVFVDEVWPRYLDHNTCARPSCHPQVGGVGYFRVLPTLGAAPTGAFETWPDDWRFNYLGSIPFVRCDAPQKSRLLATPAGTSDPHPPGDAVDNLDEAMQIFQDWVSGP